METIELPSRADQPIVVLLWDIDALAPICLLMMAGFLVDQVLTLTFVGMLLSSLYTRFRDAKPDGYFLHLLYWHGIFPVTSKSIPNAFSRFFVN